MNEAPAPSPPLPPGVLVVRPGLGANCSSIGSVVDLIFAAGALGGALVVGLTAWLEGRDGPGGAAGPAPGEPEGRGVGSVGAGEPVAREPGGGARAGGRAARGAVPTAGPGGRAARGAVSTAGPGGRRLRARLEPFGAWVRLDEPPLLVAVDRALARELGLEGGALWAGAAPAVPSAPLEAHLSVTERCPLPCEGCYLDATPDGASPSTEALIERLGAIADAGTFRVAFGGGEPLVRPDLGELARRARAFGLSPVLTTSGAGMTAARATELAAFDQVNVSYDGEGEGYRAVRGFGGALMAERAMGLLREAGVRFGVNVVLTRRSFGQIEATARRARALGAAEVQLLRFKPAGRGVGPVYEGARLDEGQARGLYPLLERLVGASGGGVRIDCALVPFLSPYLDDAAALERFGVFGCEAERHLGAVRADGSAAPCSFAPREPLVAPSRLARAAPRRYRAHAESPPEPCASCALRRACRGGCRVVAAHAGDPAGPDPECPRVLERRREGGPLA